jgi:chromosome segregation ATPase
MKEEFALLMKKRAAVAEQCRESQACIHASRSMLASNPQANSETGRRYRESAMAVERALDAHPQIVALQEQYVVAQTQKVAVSSQKAELMSAWRKARGEREQKSRAAIEQAGAKAGEARKDLFKQAGVGEYAKLSEVDQKRFIAIEDQWNKEVAAIKTAKESLAADEKTERERDGSAKRLADLEEQYKALESRQAECKAQINALRTSLRKSDPGIAALQAAAVETTHAHMVAIEATPDVARAKAFLDSADGLQSALDVRARALRKAILAKDPEYRKVLDGQAAPAGLALVGEDFWLQEG